MEMKEKLTKRRQKSNIKLGEDDYKAVKKKYMKYKEECENMKQGEKEKIRK
jgi:hypothetical protein